MMPCDDSRSACYRTLNPEKLVDAARRLSDKVNAAFPNSGLGALACEVACLTRETIVRLTFIERPNWRLRIGVGVLVLLTVLGPLIFSTMIQFSESVSSLGDFLEATDAGLQMLLLLGGSIAFLVTWESRTCLRDCRASEFWNYREQR